MLSQHLKKYITVETKTKQHQLKCSEYARWLCLLEALDVVSRGAERFKVDLNNNDIDWIKPLSFQKYVAERYESMIEEVLDNELNIKIPLNRFKEECTTSSEPVLT